MMNVCVFCFAVWTEGATASLNLNLDFRRAASKWIYLVCFLIALRSGLQQQNQGFPLLQDRFLDNDKTK